MTNRFLRGAAVLTLVALALMVWSVLQPTPLPVMLAMSLGQVIGTAAFAMYGYVVIRDLRRQFVRRRDVRMSGEMKTVQPSGPVPVTDTAKPDDGAGPGAGGGT